jgi:hypothetical protein
MNAADKTWRVNAISGELESPEADWLINRLAALTAGEPRAAVSHAHRILVAVNMLRARRHERRRRNDDRRRELGPTVEMRDLQAAARLAIKRRDNISWMKAWAAASPRTRRLVWSPEIAPGSNTGEGFQRESPKGLAFGFLEGKRQLAGQLLAPYPEDAVGLIKDASRRLKAVSGKRTRKQDALVDNLFSAIRTAAIELSAYATRASIHKLIKDVDSHFKLGVAPPDSDRIRRHISARKPTANTPI